MVDLVLSRIYALLSDIRSSQRYTFFSAIYALLSDIRSSQRYTLFSAQITSILTSPLVTLRLPLSAGRSGIFQVLSIPYCRHAEGRGHSLHGTWALRCVASENCGGALSRTVACCLTIDYHNLRPLSSTNHSLLITNAAYPLRIRRKAQKSG